MLLIETQYLPPIHVVAVALRCGGWTIEAHEHYHKRSYRNRCHLVGANGLLSLSIPLCKGKNQQMPITQVQVAQSDPWQRTHWRTIASAYGRAPFYEHYAPALQVAYMQPTTTLWNWNQHLLELLLHLLRLPLAVAHTTEYTPASQVPDSICDYRNRLLPTRPLPLLPAYPQVFGERYGFVGGLSILDALFCLGPAAGDYLQRLSDTLPNNPLQSSAVVDTT